MTDIPLDKQSENALRRRAERLGFELHKSRRRDPQAPDYGRYALVDRVTQEPLGGILPLVGMYRFTADELERALDLQGLARQAGPEAVGSKREKDGIALTSALLPVHVERVPKMPLRSKEWAEWCLQRGLAQHSDGRIHWPARSTDVNLGDYLVYQGGELISVASEADLILKLRL